MCWSSVVEEYLVEYRLAEARAASARWNLHRSLRHPRRPLRTAVGQWLVGAGQRLLRPAPPGRRWAGRRCAGA
jgi:hypothetical protein